MKLQILPRGLGEATGCRGATGIRSHQIARHAVRRNAGKVNHAEPAVVKAGGSPAGHRRVALADFPAGYGMSSLQFGLFFQDWARTEFGKKSLKSPWNA